MNDLQTNETEEIQIDWNFMRTYIHVIEIAILNELEFGINALDWLRSIGWDKVMDS